MEAMWLPQAGFVSSPASNEDGVAAKVSVDRAR